MKQENAFLQAFDEYADALYRHCFFRLSDKERAHDLVADAFTKTWDYLVRGNSIDDFKPFLYQTLNRLIIDEYRKKKHTSLDVLLEEDRVPEGVFSELVSGGREDVEFAFDAQYIPTLLEEMPVRYREVVMMRYMEGLQPAEIATLLEESVNLVSVRIHRGMQWLTERYKKLEEGNIKKTKK